MAYTGQDPYIEVEWRVTFLVRKDVAGSINPDKVLDAVHRTHKSFEIHCQDGVLIADSRVEVHRQ